MKTVILQSPSTIKILIVSLLATAVFSLWYSTFFTSRQIGVSVPEIYYNRISPGDTLIPPRP
jgi:hypothetical protein